MAGSGVTLYASTASGNKVVIGSIDWRENTYMPSQINDNVAQIMADVRAMANSVAIGWIEFGDGDGVYTATYIAANQFRIDGADVSAYYRAGMRVRVVAPTPGTISGTITASAFATHTTITVAWDSGALSNEAITSVSIGIGSGGGAGGQPSYRNILGRNGGFEVWQRGAGGSAAFGIAASGSQYTADGWFVAVGTNQASTVSQQTGRTNGSNYALAVTRNSGQTGVGAMLLEFPLDADELALMRGSIVSLSLTLQALGNFSPAGGNITINLYVGTGTPAKRVLGAYAGETSPISVVQPITTATTRYNFTSSAAVPANAGQASLVLSWTPVGTAGAADGFYIDDVQLEVGSGATPFERRPFESELAACKRHYQKTLAYITAPANAAGQQDYAWNSPQIAPASTAVDGYFCSLPVEMRSAPTVTLYNPEGGTAGQIRNIWTASDFTGSTAAGSTRGVRMSGTSPAATGANNRIAVHIGADAGI